MRAAMANADVGDDVIDVDPTCERPAKAHAEILAKRDPVHAVGSDDQRSGANPLQARRRFICEAGCHIYNYEQGACQLSGVVAKTVEAKPACCTLTARGWCGRKTTISFAPASSAWRKRTIAAQAKSSRTKRRRDLQVGSRTGLRTHLDGARLWNASAARHRRIRVGQALLTRQRLLQQGLALPVGSALAGPKDFIKEAAAIETLRGNAPSRHHRRRRALAYRTNRKPPHSRPRHAQIIAELSGSGGSRSSLNTSKTTSSSSASTQARQCRESPPSSKPPTSSPWPSARAIRLVTHLDVTESQCVQAPRLSRNRGAPYQRQNRQKLEPAY